MEPDLPRVTVSYRHGVSVSTAFDAGADDPAAATGDPTADAGTEVTVGEVVVDVLDGALAEADIQLETPLIGFQVRLANFSGPFDLLLQLIGKHKLDVTEVALHTVTDEFIAYIRAMGDAWDLDEASEFLVIAATLLDLKAARLLPSANVEDEEDLALLEARDLLFARLLQYKAYKEAAAFLQTLEGTGARRFARAVALEPQFADALPELVLGIGPQRLAALAIKAMTPKVVPTVHTEHVHMERVSVREHAAMIRDALVRQGTATFRGLCSDCQSTLEVVARFLALLELYREGLVSFDQVQALGELTVRWTGAADAPLDLQVDEYVGAPEPVAATDGSRSEADPDAGDDDDDDQDTDLGTADATAGETEADAVGARDDVTEMEEDLT